MSVRLTRQQLYRWIWTTPAGHIADVLGVSGSALGKTCRRYGVPTPARGYWRKVQTGQKVFATPLPDVQDVRLTPVEVSEDVALALSGGASTAGIEECQSDEQAVSVGSRDLRRAPERVRGQLKAQATDESGCSESIQRSPDALDSAESLIQPDVEGLIWLGMEDGRFAQSVCALGRLHAKLPELDPSTAATVSLWLLAARQQLQHLDPVEQIVASCRLIASGDVETPRWWKAVQGLN